MNLACARCLREGRHAPVASGPQGAVVRRGAQPARPAVTITGGEALCADHLHHQPNGA